MSDLRDATRSPGGIVQMRRGPAADWTAVNPVLRSGEEGFESDTGRVKVGDGSTVWTDLPYQGAASVGIGAPASLAPGAVYYELDGDGSPVAVWVGR